MSHYNFGIYDSEFAFYDRESFSGTLKGSTKYPTAMMVIGGSVVGIGHPSNSVGRIPESGTYLNPITGEIIYNDGRSNRRNKCFNGGSYYNSSTGTYFSNSGSNRQDNNQPVRRSPTDYQVCPLCTKHGNGYHDKDKCPMSWCGSCKGGSFQYHTTDRCTN